MLAPFVRRTGGPRIRLGRTETAAAVQCGRSSAPGAEDDDVVGFVLAGGKGARLMPLTASRAKAAIGFGGGYRLVDFVLSNFTNSGIYSVGVLTQFENGPLLRHLHEVWQPIQPQLTALPERTHRGELWYRGTADAVYQNLHLLEQASPRIAAVFGADHVYRMDVRQMMAHHCSRGASATVSALPVPLREASRFGTVEVDPDWRIVGFHEKIARPPEIPGRPGWALVSMGNYLFEPEALASELSADASDSRSAHDFGHNVLPAMIRRHPVYAYDFRSNNVPGDISRGYWRDVGTVQAYYQANLETLPAFAEMDLANPLWPIQTGRDLPVACRDALPLHSAASGAVNSVVGSGCIVEGRVFDSVLGRNVVVERGAEVTESIVMDNCRIGAGARVYRTILDEDSILPSTAQIGCQECGDESLYFYGGTGIELIQAGGLTTGKFSHGLRRGPHRAGSAETSIARPGINAWAVAGSGA